MFGKRRVYLDAAAGIAPNPSSPHEEGRRARVRLDAARERIARCVEVKADDVIFTSGATEANALAIAGVVHAAQARGAARIHMLYLPSSHASVVANMKALADAGIDAEPLPLSQYAVDAAALARLVRPETALVSMDAVCGETGIVWNTREVRQALDRAGSTAYLHVDASQAPFTEKLTRAHFGADLMTLDASKVGAVRGAGALIAHRTIPLAPLYEGGGQERGLRPGTEPVELVESFANALSGAAEGREAFRAHAADVREVLARRISASVPRVFINGAEGFGLPSGRQAPHILNISLPERDTDYLVALLDREGFAVATRSACETDSEEGSRAVLALTGERDRARATLRVSWGPSAKRRDLERFPRALAEAVAFIDSASAG